MAPQPDDVEGDGRVVERHVDWAGQQRTHDENDHHHDDDDDEGEGEAGGGGLGGGTGTGMGWGETKASVRFRSVGCEGPGECRGR